LPGQTEHEVCGPVRADGYGDSPPVCERTATHIGVRTRWWSGGLAEEAMERCTLSKPNTPNLRPERFAARLFQKKSAASGEQTCFLRIVVLETVRPRRAAQAGAADGGTAIRRNNQASSLCSTLPCTSVRRKSRPWNLKVSFSCSKPRRCKIVACRSCTWAGSSATPKPSSSVWPKV